MPRTTRHASFLLPVLLLVPVGSRAPADVRIVNGGCADVHGASVCTYAKMSGRTLVEFGLTVPIASITNAPDTQSMVWPPRALALIALPEEVGAATGFRYVNVFWEAHGHPPRPFMVPHFDFHFYAHPTDSTDAIDCTDTSKPARLPRRYALPDVEVPELGSLPGLCVPRMGMHAMDEDVLSGARHFGATMVVGYYHGQVVFIEPMIARETLELEQSFPLDIPAIPDAPAGVRTPTRFHAQYDAKAKAYRFAFMGLPQH